jgi:hypothetical protein
MAAFAAVKDSTMNELLLRLFTDDCALSNFKKRFFSALDDETRIFDLLDLPYHAAVRYDLVVYLQLRDHFLKLVTLFLLRQNDEKIEDSKNKNEGQQRPDQTDPAGILEK